MCLNSSANHTHVGIKVERNPRLCETGAIYQSINLIKHKLSVGVVLNHIIDSPEFTGGFRFKFSYLSR